MNILLKNKLLFVGIVLFAGHSVGEASQALAVPKSGMAALGSSLSVDEFLKSVAERYQIFQNAQEKAQGAPVQVCHAFLYPRDIVNLWAQTEHKEFFSKLKGDSYEKDCILSLNRYNSLRKVKKFARLVDNKKFIDSVDKISKATGSITMRFRAMGKATQTLPAALQYYKIPFLAATGIFLGGVALSFSDDAFVSNLACLSCVAAIALGVKTYQWNKLLEKENQKDLDFYEKNIKAREECRKLIDNQIRLDPERPFNSNILASIASGMDLIMKKHKLPY